jgi:hypothetical protein
VFSFSGGEERKFWSVGEERGGTFYTFLFTFDLEKHLCASLKIFHEIFFFLTKV